MVKYVINGYEVKTLVDLMKTYNKLDYESTVDVVVRALSHLGLENTHRGLETDFLRRLARDLVEEEQDIKWIYEAVFDMRDCLESGVKFVHDDVLDVRKVE